MQFVEFETQAATCDQSTKSESIESDAFVSVTVTVCAACTGFVPNILGAVEINSSH